MWNKKWYFKRNISCDAHLLNELLEMDVPWDDAIVVSACKLRKLWDCLSELRSSVCDRRLKRTILRPALLPVKTAQFTQFFGQVWRHTVKSLSLRVYRALYVMEVIILYEIKEKLSLRWIKRHTTKTYEGVEMQLHWFITSAQDDVSTAQHSSAGRSKVHYRVLTVQ